MLACCASTAAFGAVQGLSLEDGFTARALAMGSAFQALPNSMDALETDPAVLPFFRAYQVDLHGAWDWTSKAGDFGTYVRDSSTSALAAGTGYHLLSTGRGSLRETTNLFSLGLGIPLGSALAMGVSGHYLLRSNSADPANAVTVDLGLAAKLADMIFVSVGGHNLVSIDHPELTRFYSVAVGLMMGLLNADVDVRSTLSNGFLPTVHGGVEAVLGNTVALPVRAGYEVDTRADTQYFSVGAGVASEGSGMDLAYRHQVKGGSSDLLVLSFKTQF
jgi:hypothetical protein